MRLLTVHQQRAVIEATCTFFRTHSTFKVDAPSTQGPCGSSIRIISGEEEGLFGWIAVNYLMDGFSSHEQNHRATYGFLDMGGASTQIAFEPSESERAGMSKTTADELVGVRLRLLGGEEIQHQVFVTTWLGYGTNQARERYLGQEVQEWDAHSDHVPEAPIPEPCLPKGLILDETPIPDNTSADSHNRKPHKFIGTGSFTQCVEETAPLLNKTAPCPDASCLFNGVAAPKIDFSLSKFIGVSEYWYSSEHVFGLGGAYDYVEYERAASKFCGREWSDIVAEHDRSRAMDGLPREPSGGVFRWGKEVGLNRLQMQCFKAAWIVNVLHEGIGMPRIVDAGGNRTTHEVDEAGEKADHKNLGEIPKKLPTFSSVDTIGDTTISWTLGKMVLEASKEVPALSSKLPPLSDPDPHGYGAVEPPFRDHVRTHRGLTFQAAFPVVLVLVGVFFVCGRMLLRFWMRRSRRRPMGGMGTDTEEAVGLFDYHSPEEGTGYFSSSSGSSPPSTPRTLGAPSKSHIIRSLRHLVRTFSGAGSQSRPRRPKSRSNAVRPRLASRTKTLPSPTAAGSFFHPAPTLGPAKKQPSSGTNSRMGSRPGSAMSMVSTARPMISSTPSRSFSGASIITRNALPPLFSSRLSSSESDNGEDHDDSANEDLDDGPPTARPGMVSRSSLQLPYGDLSRNSSQVNLTTAVPRTLGMSRTPTNPSFDSQWVSHHD